MFASKLHIKSVVAVFFAVFLTTFIPPQELVAQSKVVVAKKGDGIYRLLTRHGYSVSSSMDDFIALNKSSLGKDNTLIAGVKYKLPESGGGGTSSAKTTKATKTPAKTVRYDIFGPEHAEVEISGSSLKGAVYYLVGGHGGPDPGAVGKYNGYKVYEDEYAYDVTLRLAKCLISEGATVYLITRDKNDGIRNSQHLKLDHDEVCYPNLKIPLNPNKRLRQRTDAVNKLYKKHKGAYQRMIAMHIDSRHSKQNIDIFFYHDKRSKAGEAACKTLRDTIEKKYKEYQPSRGYTGTVSPRGLYVIRNTYPTAIFIELGNMNHQRDVKRLILDGNRQTVAYWLYLGLQKDYLANK